MCSTTGSADAPRGPARRRARATSSSVGSKGSTSWATSLVSPALLVVEPALDEDELSTPSDSASASIGLVEDEHLDLALDVVERREHHLLAALGPDGA